MPFAPHSAPRTAFQTVALLSRRRALLGLIPPRSALHQQQSATPFPQQHPTKPGSATATALSAKKPLASFSPFAKLARVAGGGGMAKKNGNGDASLWNLPNILTLGRVFSIPVLIAIFYMNTVRFGFFLLFPSFACKKRPVD